MAARAAPLDLVDRLGIKLVLLWAGLSVGVGFVATPAKFLAQSLSLPVALDVGRHTFAVYGVVEMTLLLCMVIVGAASAARVRWLVALAVPGAMVLGQYLWLRPALDLRVSAILAGGLPPASSLHAVYIAAETLKVLCLLGIGLGGGFVIARSKPAAERQLSPEDRSHGGEPP